MTEWEKKFIDNNYSLFEMMIKSAFKMIANHNADVYLWYNDLINEAWLRLFTQIPKIIDRFKINEDNMDLIKRDEIWRAKFFKYIKILAYNAILLKSQQITEKDSAYVMSKLDINFSNIKSSQNGLSSWMLEELEEIRRDYLLKCEGVRVILNLLILTINEGVNIDYENRRTLIKYLQSRNQYLASLKPNSINQYLTYIVHPDKYLKKI